MTRPCKLQQRRSPTAQSVDSSQKLLQHHLRLLTVKAAPARIAVWRSPAQGYCTEPWFRSRDLHRTAPIWSRPAQKMEMQYVPISGRLLIKLWDNAFRHYTWPLHYLPSRILEMHCSMLTFSSHGQVPDSEYGKKYLEMQMMDRSAPTAQLNVVPPSADCAETKL